MLGNELALTGGFPPAEREQHAPWESSYFLPLSITNQRESDCSRGLSTSSGACAFPVTFTHNRISFTRYRKVLVTAGRRCSSNSSTLGSERERFSVTRGGGERADGQAEERSQLQCYMLYQEAWHLPHYPVWSLPFCKVNRCY